MRIPFVKVVRVASVKEFEKAKQVEDCIVATESAWDGKETAIGYLPRANYPNRVQCLKKFGSSTEPIKLMGIDGF